MDEHLEARDAKLRQLAFDVSAALAGNNVVDAIGAATVLGCLLLVALKLAAILALPWYAYVSVLVAGVALFVSGVISPSPAARATA